MTRILFMKRRAYRKQFKCNFLRKLRDFCGFFASYLKSAQNLDYFQKKKSLIGYLFPKLETMKNANIAEICTATLLPYFVITLGEIELENVSLNHS